MPQRRDVRLNPNTPLYLSVYYFLVIDSARITILEQ